MLAPPVKSGPRYNQMINVPKVRVIDENGENLGVMYTREAIDQAAEVGLDLVEVSPNADPPVCKFLDVGKFRYEAQKKANAARKSQKTQEIKEIKMRPNIDDHDYDVKMRNVHRFIEDGAAFPWPRAFAPAAGHEPAQARAGRCCRNRQDRSLPPHGRPPDADGAGPQGLNRSSCGLTKKGAPCRARPFSWARPQFVADHDRQARVRPR